MGCDTRPALGDKSHGGCCTRCNTPDRRNAGRWTSRRADEEHTLPEYRDQACNVVVPLAMYARDSITYRPGSLWGGEAKRATAVMKAKPGSGPGAVGCLVVFRFRAPVRFQQFPLLPSHRGIAPLVLWGCSMGALSACTRRLGTQYICTRFGACIRAEVLTPSSPARQTILCMLPPPPSPPPPSLPPSQ